MKNLFSLVIVSIPLLVSISSTAGCGPSIEESNQWFVSIVRPDGILRPFAIYDSGNWLAPWPQTFRMKEPYESKMTSLADIPPSWYAPLPEMPNEWYMQENDGNTLKVHVSKPAVARASCVEEWGLLSDYPPKLLGIRSLGGPLIKQGIAVSQPISMNPFREVNRYSYEWRELRDPVLVEFKESEQELPHSSPENISAARGMSVQKLIRAEVPGETPIIYYFEAEKEYWKEKTTRKGGPKYDIGFLKGWILRTDEHLTILKKDFRYASAHGMGIAKEQPLGMIVVDGITYWVQEHKYYEGEAYVILKVSSQGIEQVLMVSGGGC